uniref:Uncharacterized protein n=1 Tax=Onchocerca volvulus TaxID=6282 RepID=A0A8R1XV50_ONCVO
MQAQLIRNASNNLNVKTCAVRHQTSYLQLDGRYKQ